MLDSHVKMDGFHSQKTISSLPFHSFIKLRSCSQALIFNIGLAHWADPP